MAQQTTFTLTDDIDGSKAVETVSFGLDGRHYEIDLGSKNAKNLRKVVGAYIEAARKVRANSGTPAATKKSAPSDGTDLAAIRAWAHEKGIPVAARGRIAASVKEQYLDENAS